MSLSKDNAAVFIILLAFAAAVVIKSFCFDFIITEGRSMSPVIDDSSLIAVNKLAFGFRPPFSRGYLFRWADPKTGDVLLFWTPLGDLAVKRCAGFETGGRFIALGDNSLNSFDSRSYGPVPLDNIIGKVIMFNAGGD